MEAVHYRGESPMWADFLAGSLQGGTGAWFVAQSVLQNGKGRAIAVSQKRMKKLPGVQTFAEQGVTSACSGCRASCARSGRPACRTKSPIASRTCSSKAGKGEKIQQLLDQFGIDDSAIGRARLREARR